MNKINKTFFVFVALIMCGCSQYVIKHGEGVLTSSNGDTFEGELKDGKPLIGSLYDKQGFEKESLDFDTTNVKQGEGSFTFENGDTFEGELKDGKPWNGTLYDQKGFEKKIFSKGV
ncbi:MAG: hypothetical protein QF434_09220 [Nitrospinaceae bacterium]|jgi:hypothetical protein|nr:hypothetical protein [Nitrospinaceae bacterium]